MLFSQLAKCSALAATLAVVPCISFSHDGLDTLVPIVEGSSYSTTVEALRALRGEYGLRRFIVSAPGQLRNFGHYDLAYHKEFGARMARLKRDLADTDIEIGWWDDPTIRGGFDEPGQHIMDCDGNVCDALCPLDEKANEAYMAYLKAAASQFRPSLYFFEDDFTLSNHAGLNAMKGCFCPLHLAAFARRVGKSFTAREIAGMFRDPTPGNEPLRRAFAEVSRESLAQLGRQIRAAIDAVDPSARVCLCQSGFVDVDGDSTEAIARALAGGTRPMVRIYGAGYYNENHPDALPMELAHVFWSVQHLPKDVEVVHESDPFPHSRFYNSARFLMSEVAAAFMAGVDDSFLYCTMYSDEPLRDTAYAKAFVESRARLAAVRAFRRASSLVGVRAVYDPEEVYLQRETSKGAASGMLTECARILAKLGFPMTTRAGAASVLFGSTAKYLSEDKLREVLSGAALVDAEAALELQKRGLGAWLGCKVRDDDKMRFWLERTLPADGLRKAGSNPYHKRNPGPPIIGWSETKQTVYVRIEPGEGTETQAVFEDTLGNVVAPSFVRSANALGGRVGVLAFSVCGNREPALYDSLKQELLRNFFDTASGGALDVCAPHPPGTWLAAAVADDGKSLLVMVNNLAGEPRDDIALDFAAKWRGGRLERLSRDGAWAPAGTAEATTRLGVVCEPMVAEFLRISR